MLAVAWLVSTALAADGLPLGGRVFTDFYIPAKDISTDAMRQSSASLWLQGEPRLGENSGATFIVEANAFEASLMRVSRTGVALREGYAFYNKNGFDLRAGRQIIPWGKTDAITPTDFLSAKDYTFLNPDDEVRRIGATSLSLSYTPRKGASPLTLTAIWTPVFPQSKILINPDAIPTTLPAGLSVSTTPVTPTAKLSNTELGLRATLAMSGWDASVLAFRGYNHTPEFAVFGTSIAPTFHKQTAIGADASFTVKSWVFRGEGDFVWTENPDGLNPTVSPSRWDVVAGAEHPFLTDFRFQVQGLLRYHPYYLKPSQATGPDPVTTSLAQQIAAVNALVMNYQDQWRPGMTLRVSYSNESNGLEGEIFTLANFTGGDYLFQPKASYAWTDAFKTTVGLQWYGGPTDRPLGQLNTYNSIFTEAKYSF